MKFLINTFLKGLLVILPLFITLGLIYWLLSTAETLLQVPLALILPTGWYRPGMGVAAALVLIFSCGLLVQNFFVRHFFNLMDWVLGHIPFVNTLYQSARDLMQFAFGGDRQRNMQKVVTVEFQEGIELMGFITNDNIGLSELEDKVAVFFPMSYQMGGYLAYLPRAKCRPVDLPVDKAMQLILTAHMLQTGTAEKS